MPCLLMPLPGDVDFGRAVGSPTWLAATWLSWSLWLSMLTAVPMCLSMARLVALSTSTDGAGNLSRQHRRRRQGVAGSGAIQ
jgi:hypothetical protein